LVGHLGVVEGHGVVALLLLLLAHLVLLLLHVHILLVLLLLLVVCCGGCCRLGGGTHSLGSCHLVIAVVGTSFEWVLLGCCLLVGVLGWWLVLWLC
jgi:hypothetical protein